METPKTQPAASRPTCQATEQPLAPDVLWLCQVTGVPVALTECLECARHRMRRDNIKSIENIYAAITSPFTPRRTLFLVRFNIYTPVGTLTRTQHATRTVFFFQGDHSTGARWRIFSFMWILHRYSRFQHCFERNAQAF